MGDQPVHEEGAGGGDPTREPVESVNPWRPSLEQANPDSDQESNSSSSSKDSDVDEGPLSVLCWNVDGLMRDKWRERAQAVYDVVSKNSVDVVFLQEVVISFVIHLSGCAKEGDYSIIPGDTEGYFTAVMLKNSRVRFISHEIFPFPTSTMMRHLLAVKAEVSGRELYLLTSHLESMGPKSEERVRQLRRVLRRMALAPAHAAVIFGGDTNLRDKEVRRMGGLPGGVADVWEELGCPEEARYTWDLSLNDNHQFDPPATPRLRFDRLLFRRVEPRRSSSPAAGSAAVAAFAPLSLRFVGTERLPCGKFPSDHWGLLAHFQLWAERDEAGLDATDALQALDVSGE
ncbi:tyrosyl-DNA phosphodiesterase 2-like [Petromyzon marinus]|uniref:tyrosyl-DNA phosphodiesterase 2-like n=1 Tax=Petromyzon marinus TaxID=7757 RepID=UPI003F6E7616